MRILALTYYKFLRFFLLVGLSCLNLSLFGQTTPTAKLLSTNGETWNGGSFPCGMTPNAEHYKKDCKYLKGRIGYLSNDDYGGKNVVSVKRVTKAEGEAFVAQTPQKYFRKTCLSVSYDKDWVGGATTDKIDPTYPAIVYAYSVEIDDKPGCYDIYYYVSDDSNPLVEGSVKKLFKTGSCTDACPAGGNEPMYSDLSGLAYWDFENISDMQQMFANCTQLIEIELNGTFLGPIGSMFSNCKSLESIKITGITNKLTSMKEMFKGLSNLHDVMISGDFSGVTSTMGMFNGCSSLEDVNLIGSFSSQLKEANQMFNSCTSLPSVCISGTFENVTTTQLMFNNCRELVTVDIPGNLLKNTNTNQMFQNCQKLENITNDLTFGSSLTNMEYMFSNCMSLTELTLKGVFSGVTTTSNMFNSATGLTSVSIGDGNANFSSLLNAKEMFQKWPESKYDVFKEIVSQMTLDIDKFPGGKTDPYKMTKSDITGRWKGGVDGDTVVTANGLVYRMDNGYMTYWHILPIDLWKFNVSQDNDNLLFFWKTACETNNECFILEYSLDGSSYSTIARVAGAGNSSRINSYSAVWESVPYTGMLYFRLKQCDFSGHITYSNVLVYNMTCNPCKNDSLPKIYYGKSQYRIYNKKLIFCKGDNERE